MPAIDAKNATNQTPQHERAQGQGHRRGQWRGQWRGHWRANWRVGVLAILFPVAAWLVATLAFFGDVPRWNDDWFFCQRDFSTSERIGWIVTTREPFLPPTGTLQAWRPLHHSWLPIMVTTLWEYPRVITLIGALIQLAAAALLYRMLRALGCVPHASAAAALLFLVWPSSYETVLWAAAFSTGLACVCAFSSVILAIKFAKATSTARCARLLGAIVMLIAACVTLNEQPAAIAGVLPLAVVAVGLDRRGRMSDGRVNGLAHWQTSILRALPKAALVCGLATSVVLVYFINVRVNGQKGLGADTASYVHLDQLPMRIGEVLRGMSDWYALIPIAQGAWTLAQQEFAAHPLVGSLWCALLIASAALSWQVWVRFPTHANSASDQGLQDSAIKASRVPWWCVSAIGAAMIVFGAIPIAAIVGYQANSRTSVFIFAGVCVVIAGVSDAIGNWVQNRTRFAKPYRAATGALLIGLGVVAAVVGVGIQARFRDVDVWNRAQHAKLVERVPNPAPDTAFLPVGIFATPMHTGHKAFDAQLGDCWQGSWMLPFAIREAYKKRDVYQLYYKPGQRVIGMITPEWMQFEWGAASRFPMEDGFGARLDWPRVIPIVIKEDGPHAVTRLIARRKRHADVVIDIPQTSAMAARGEIPELEFVIEQD